MAAVRTRSQRVLHRVAVAAVVIITLIFLSPIYWIGSTAFKARAIATSVPPTVFFQPEITPFNQIAYQARAIDQGRGAEVYAAAPWWEQRIYDGGERVLKVGDKVQLSQYPNRFQNSLIIAITSTLLAVSMGTLTAYGFSDPIAGEADLLFFILSTRMLPRWWWRSPCS